MRRLCLTALGLLACAAGPACRGAAPEVERARLDGAAEGSGDEAPAPPSRRDLEARLRGCAVTDEDFARPVLYTWTTTEQAEALRRDRVLLVASADSAPGPSPFNLALLAAARSRSPAGEVAHLLLEREGLTKRRYAWTCPFATAVPNGPRSYGHVLLRVELRQEALIGRFEAGEPEAPITFRDLAGQVVDRAEALARPERIAAIFHVRRRAGAPFREYVLCNEAMVASFSLGTPELAALIEDERALLRSLRAVAGAAEGAATRPADAWARLAPGSGLEQLWDASSAFASERHRLDPANLEAMLDALGEHDPDGPALVVDLR